MKVLKGLGIGVLSFLLFLSLSIFGIVFMLNSTLLNPDFVVKEVDKVDMSSLAREVIGKQISGKLPQELNFLEDAIYNIVSDQEPWLKEQLNTVIYSGYGFFLGKSQSLNIVISLEPLKASLGDSLWQAFKKNPTSELSGLSQDQLKLYFDQYYQEFAGQIPSEFEINESLIPSEAMEQILLARKYISYSQIVYKALIGFMLLLVLLIILINRNVRDTTRGLGINLLIYGALEFAGVFVARNYIPTILPLHDIPSPLQNWALGVYGDLLSPLQMFSLGILIGGAVLLAVSFIFKTQAAED